MESPLSFRAERANHNTVTSQPDDSLRSAQIQSGDCVTALHILSRVHSERRSLRGYGVIFASKGFYRKDGKIGKRVQVAFVSSSIFNFTFLISRFHFENVYDKF